jgi:hypothetical protein
MFAYVNLWIEIHLFDWRDSCIMIEELMALVVNFMVGNLVYWQPNALKSRY